MNFLKGKEGILGAKMVVVLAEMWLFCRRRVFEKIKEELKNAYRDRFKIELAFHEIESADGVQKIWRERELPFLFMDNINDFLKFKDTFNR